MLDLATLRSQAVAVTVEFGPGASIEVEYCPNVLTPRFEQEIRKQKGDAETAVLTKTLAALLRKWDLVDGGKPVPITETGLSGVPVEILAGVFQAIMEHALPNPTKGRPAVTG